jgi:hypothetical protein
VITICDFDHNEQGKTARHALRSEPPTWPALNMEISVTAGCQEYGRCTEPVSSRIGFGAWHATCSAVHDLLEERPDRCCTEAGGVIVLHRSWTADPNTLSVVLPGAV